MDDTWSRSTDSPQQAVRTIAFYLPQFHPIPENDTWWGRGYTEWQRVARARPQFRGHHQPHLPADLGYYDLRLPETRLAQAELATAYGVDAFCYYHYWFSGRRLLERPFNEVLESGQPSLPFALCWANEPWTRAWDGHNGDVLLEQRDSPGDAERFVRDLLPAFADSRYVRVDDRPLLLVYRARQLHDPKRTTDIWRSVLANEGLGEPFLCRVESMLDERGDPRPLGFDGAVEFQPDWAGIERPRNISGLRDSARRRMRSMRTLSRRHRVVAYEDIVRFALAKPEPEYPWWRCVTPGWDNTARRDRGATIVAGSTPDLYERWVAEAAQRSVRASRQPLLFVNAWNEWSEGCHLEPAEPHGRAFLEAHKRGIRSATPSMRSVTH